MVCAARPMVEGRLLGLQGGGCRVLEDDASSRRMQRSLARTIAGWRLLRLSPFLHNKHCVVVFFLREPETLPSIVIRTSDISPVKCKTLWEGGGWVGF